MIWNLIESLLGKDFLKNPRIKNEVLKLSNRFTDDRGEQGNVKRAYRADGPEAYLAYFLPLNYFKLLRVFEESPRLTEDASKDFIRILDFGCGPATASLALLTLLKEKLGAYPKQVDINLIDSDKNMLQTASDVLKAFAKQEKVEIKIHPFSSLQECLKIVQLKNLKIDFGLAANVLNELPANEGSFAKPEPLLLIWEQVANLIVLEPAHRVASQRLIRFRKRILDYSKQKNISVHILAPCPHQGECPLYRNKYWCHFSEKLGKDKEEDTLIKLNKNIFKNPRLWLKFSYLTVKKEQPTTELNKKGYYRAIGDLHPSGPGFLAIDLCQPENKKVHKISEKNANDKKSNYLQRGRLIKL